MENPFLLAVALLESRKITTWLLAGAKKNEPDSRIKGEKPIDWRLLVDHTVRPEVAQQSAFSPVGPRPAAAHARQHKRRCGKSVAATVHEAD
jgi:hypothetical protein